MKPGDVVRVTMFRGHKCNPPAWGIAQESPPGHERLITFFEWSGVSEASQQDIRRLNPRDWGMGEKNCVSEVMHVVPLSKWPGHVCAYMAERALRGEDADELVWSNS